MDEALYLLADTTTRDPDAASTRFNPEDSGYRGEVFYIAEHWALVRLDKEDRETYERRTIVSLIDDLNEIDAVFSLPRRLSQSVSVAEMDMEVLYGAVVVERRRESDSRFRFKLRLPKPVQAGQPHEYCLLYRFPPQQFVRPYYVFVPHRRCDSLTVRVRFHPDHLPIDVRKVDHGFLRDLDGDVMGESTSLDGAGELHFTFTSLEPAMVYGARWEFAESQAGLAFNSSEER